MNVDNKKTANFLLQTLKRIVPKSAWLLQSLGNLWVCTDS